MFGPFVYFRASCGILTALAAILMVPLATRAQTTTAASGYKISKIVDSNTALPDRSGQNFTFQAYYGNQLFVTDGTSVAFTYYEHQDNNVDETLTDTDIWSVNASGGAPVRLVDTTVAAPDGGGALFGDVAVQGIGGGMVVFTGTCAGSSVNGLYAVPVGGGAIVTLVDSNTPVPGSTTAAFAFSTAPGQVSVHGSQVLFISGGGTYFVPVTGGAPTRFGDATTPLLDSAGAAYLPDGSAYASYGLQADFGGGIAAFQATDEASSEVIGVFAAPETGLTLNSGGFVDDDEFITGSNFAAPEESGRDFISNEFAVYVDDSGVPVFTGGSTDSSGNVVSGLYAFVNGAVVVLADGNTAVADGSGTLSSEVGIEAIVASGGRAYFASALTSPTTTVTEGIYSVPVVGGPVSAAIVNGDTIPGGNGLDFSGFFLTAGGAGGGKFVFNGGDSNANPYFSGLYLATPGTAVTIPAGNQLLLSNHTGGDTGPVTVTATIIPGAPAIASGATVKLSASNRSDIIGGKVFVDADGTALTTTIDLNNQALGTYDFVITNPDGTTVSQAATFTVEAASGPVLFADVIGRNVLRAGVAQPYTIIVGNKGDVDAAMVPVFLDFPSYFTCQVTTPIATLPQPADITGTFDYSQIPLTALNGDHNVLPLFVPHVPAGSLVTVQVLLNCPDDPQYAHVPFTLSASVGAPFIDAETGLPPTTDDVSFAGDRLPGKHRTEAGIPYTCGAGYYNLLVDCVATIYPFGKLASVDCKKGIAVAISTIFSSLSSDNATGATIAISYYQSEASGICTFVNCALKITPGPGTIINGVQCSFDAYSLFENCFAPALYLYASSRTSRDPNDLDGSQGDGSAAHYLSGSDPLRYAVYFENEDTASAPAQTVTITNPLDANLDLSTFSLGPISFGSTLLNPPAGSQNYSTVVDLRPANNLLVQVTAALNTASRTLTYRFVSLDPATNQPTTDPTAGFLPPDVNAPEGDGFALYYVKPKTGLATGATINDQASIVFDVNAPIATPIWTNTIDNDAPKSAVAALPSKEKTAQIPLQLTSSDNGSGVKYFNLYVSEDGGAFQPVAENIVGAATTYVGVTGHNYAFFSQAVDGAGNVEPLKTAAEAKTKIKGADLIGVWKGDVTGKTTAAGRTKLTGKFKVTNQSPNKATNGPSVVRLYLSADATLDSGDAIIGEDLPFGELAPGASTTVSFKNVKVPKALTTSGMYVIALIDPESSVKETDRSNDAVAYGPLP